MGINMSNSFLGFLLFCVIMIFLTVLCFVFARILSKMSDKILPEDE